MSIGCFLTDDDNTRQCRSGIANQQFAMLICVLYSIGNALQLQQSCTEPTIYNVKIEIQIDIPSLLVCTTRKKIYVLLQWMAHTLSACNQGPFSVSCSE